MTYSYVSNAHPNYIDGLYASYKQDPETVDAGWRRFFEGFEFAQSVIDNGAALAGTSPSAMMSEKEFGVLNMIQAYRQRAHLVSTTNPIRPRKFRAPSIDLADFNLSDADLDAEFLAGTELGLGKTSLRNILARLKSIYCGNVGFEFMHIENKEQREWLRTRIEALTGQGYNLDSNKKMRIVEKLNGAVGFENFLAKKYVAQKRFGLEGGESTIPGVDAMINKASTLGVKEAIIGMAHRGRLNVLANIMGKTYTYIFNEFEDGALPDLSFGDGDVKYHLGYSSQVQTPEGNMIDLKLVPNPSHLEAVNPVVEGFARAKADIMYSSNYDQILPIILHGDAAVAGQGLVYEVAQMSKLEGYYTGGSIHFVTNNQIGFTTDFDDARSSSYCTDVARVIQAPVFHVNGDDPEAVVFVSELAVEFRQKFNIDVYIDMVCYRRNGHNESDDPQFTQPKLYELISKHPDPMAIYMRQLVERGDIKAERAKELEAEFNDFLQARLDEVRQKPLPYYYQEPEQAWRALKKQTTSADYETSPVTAIPAETVTHILTALQQQPKDFNMLKKFNRILDGKQKLIDAGQADWAMAEHLAYGSILVEGNNVRMSGQDVKRGTFSHRNSVMFDTVTGAQYNRLNHLAEKQGKFLIYNSLLSEFAVLGFEFGYSMASPDHLVVWEAQFGDFANGAQTMIDQFISASESKWQRMSGLVMLLPHGYEGQGPEHSSARFERFLQLCAEYNMTIANITSPANFFHAIRRQQARPFRKPLVIMSPKSLLRHPKVVSNLSDFSQGGFQEVLDDNRFDTKKAAKVKRLLLCTGKIYFDLLEKQETENRDDVAIVRMEQLYPFPQKQLDAIVAKYKNAKITWVQEEPSNMGAWQYINSFNKGFSCDGISRKASASPATGYKKVHEKQQKEIVEKAFEV